MTDRNFLGIPIEGDINRGEDRVDQKPLEELSPLMQAVLDDPGVARFGWRQYTPYFNDGDPCVFGVRELWADPPAAEMPAEVRDRLTRIEVMYDEGLLTREEADAARTGVPGYQDEPDEDYRYKYDGIEYDKRWGDRDRHYNRATSSWDYDPYEGPSEATYDRLMALNDAIQSGAFDNVLLDAFGDHADITITRKGIKVEEYSHD